MLQDLGLVVDLLLDLVNLLGDMLTLLLNHSMKVLKLLFRSGHPLAGFTEPGLKLGYLSLKLSDVDLQLLDGGVRLHLIKSRRCMRDLLFHFFSNVCLQLFQATCRCR